MVTGKGSPDRLLTESEIWESTRKALEQAELDGKKVIIIIPDSTRSGPIDLFFRLFHELLSDRVAALDYLIALGTHPPMSDEDIYTHLGITRQQKQTRYKDVRIFNHRWDDASTFRTAGTISAEEVEELSDGMLSKPVPVKINNLIYDYDQVIICGPVFPHEVVGFSGGNKYFFPGISGSEVIDFTHWLGALLTSDRIIGTKDTPVRRVINRAASYIELPKLCFSLVVKGHGLAGLYIGSPEEAWSAAADLSSQVHITWVDHRYREVLSIVPEMYDDIWTAAKGMYKLAPVIEDGGEVVIYAPHITEFSYTHGDTLEEIGYHVRDYFLKQWDRFKAYPWGNLAHSTHLRGVGTYDPDSGKEEARIRVTLATGISKERCEHANLGYRDPEDIRVEDWEDREEEGVLVVYKAGEQLYRLTPEAAE